MKPKVASLKPIRFTGKEGRDFSSTLKKKVKTYFKENNISRYGNANMVIKTIFMMAAFLIPLGFIISGQFTNPWVLFMFYSIMGLGTAGVGLAVMHDANHNAYSKNKNVNKVVSRLLNMVGGYAPTWRIQHNVLHHTYTNIHGYDEDVSPPVSFLRFAPEDKYLKIHKFQFIYAWFFYGMMTLMWVTTKDFKQLYRYKKMGLTQIENKRFGVLLTELLISKFLYYLIVIAIPMILLVPQGVSWWLFPIYIFTMHFIAGLILGMIFQPAHVVPETNFPVPERDLTIENDWMIHQLETTSNFAPKNAILTWFIGGLNYQVEHHLFPNICHIHYPKISKLVKETAKEFNIPYHYHRSFAGALYYHTKMLKQLGKA